MTKTLKKLLTVSMVAAVVILSACSGSATPTQSYLIETGNTESTADTQSSEVRTLENPGIATPIITDETSSIFSAAAVTTGFGSKTALTDTNLTLASMLTYAIQDEYFAHAEYVAVLDTFGPQNPFSNILKAEESHISALTPLFTVYNIALPVDDAASRIIVPESITEALEIGVIAEIDNIAMYELFLKQDLPDDIKEVFTNLMKASESHLSAFKKALSR